jgi:hypothetical protein
MSCRVESREFELFLFSVVCMVGVYGMVRRFSGTDVRSSVLERWGYWSIIVRGTIRSFVPWIDYLFSLYVLFCAAQWKGALKESRKFTQQIALSLSTT